MSKDAKEVFAGLWTAPANAVAPLGALVEAEEVVCRLPGKIQPRPGFNRTEGTENVRRALSYDMGYITVADGPLTRLSGGSLVKDELGADLPWAFDKIFGTAVRKNEYLTCTDALRKITSISDTVAERAGSPIPSVIFQTSASSGATGPTGPYVAYRALSKRTDANGLITRSNVSGRALVATTSVPTNVTLRILLGKNTSKMFVAGDILELYRTFDETVNPPTDELYQVSSITVAAGDITVGYVDFVDAVPERNLGQALYTNISVEGEEAGHVALPTAGCSALFNGSLWLGNLTFPAQAAYGVMLNGGSFSTLTTVGIATSTQTLTNGSASFTSSQAANLQIGMIIQTGVMATDWGTLTEPVRILTIVGTTITATKTWQGSTSSQAVVFHDSIKIGSRYFPISSMARFLAAVRGTRVGALTTDDLGVQPGSDLVYADNETDNTDAITSVNTGWQYFRLTGLGVDSGSFTVNATKGNLYDPPIPLIGATAITVTVEAQPAAVCWSNDAKPEHLKGTNVQELDVPSGRVLSMEPVRGALMILTDRGAWRASGYEASGVRFDQVDRSVRPLNAYCSATLGDTIYVWGDQGVYEGSADAFQSLTPLALAALLPPQRTIGVGSTTAGGAFLAGNLKDDELIVGVPAVGALTVSERLYVYNRKTKAWTNWLKAHSITCIMYQGASGLVYGYAFTGTNLLVEKVLDLADPTQNSDTVLAGSVSAVAADGVTITSADGNHYAVGDLLVQGGDYFLVTAVASAGHFTVEKAGLVVGSLTAAYIAFTSVITAIGATGGATDVRKLWGEGTIAWGSREGLRQITLTFRSPTSLASTESSAVRVLSATRMTDTPITLKAADASRFTVPRVHARSTRLYPSVKIRQAGSRWELETISVKFQAMSDRVRTKFG